MTQPRPDEPSVPLADRLAADAAALERELTEIDLLVTQARTEAARHEQRRAQAGEKGGDAEQLLTLTRRAALMDAQVEVLEGKRKALTRFRDAVAAYRERLGDGAGAAGEQTTGAGATEVGASSPEAARVTLAAQEDLRREIARAMHDGPAQSLTNIVLQAQVVERMVGRDPEAAHREVQQLVGMVQQTLEATKAFIFDVRPMVLDDLGLVPTLRRACRDRGRRAGIPVEFESVGADQRLSADVESAVFRILDEALAALLSERPEQVTLRLDWADALDAHLAAYRAAEEIPPDEFEAPPEASKRRRGRQEPEELPPALAGMIEERRSAREAAIAAARAAAVVRLPAGVERDVVARAAAIGAELRIDEDTGALRVHVAIEAAAAGS